MLLLITSHTLETADVPQGPLRAKYKNHSWENGAARGRDQNGNKQNCTRLKLLSPSQQQIHLRRLSLALKLKRL